MDKTSLVLKVAVLAALSTMSIPVLQAAAGDPTTPPPPEVHYVAVKGPADSSKAPNYNDDRALLPNSIAIGPSAVVAPEGGKGEGGIAIGRGAYSHVMTNGRHEAIIAFNHGEHRDTMIGGIAMGDNTHARIGSIDIGNRDYKGLIGDIDFKGDSKNIIDAIGATTIGTNSINSANFSSVNGAFNAITNRPTRLVAGNFLEKLIAGASNVSRATQGIGSTITGTLNSIENNYADGSSYSGVASNIVGMGNRIKRSNGILIMGSGNTVEDSYLNGGSLPIDFLNYGNKAGMATIKEMADKFLKYAKDNRLGSVGVIGGANEVKTSLFSNVIGVGNTLKGADDAYNDFLTPKNTYPKFSAFNSINGYDNKATNTTHTFTAGSYNELENVTNLIAMGNNLVVKGTDAKVNATGNILLGFNSEKSDTAIKAGIKDLVALGNNIKANTDHSVYLGNDTTEATTATITAGMNAYAEATYKVVDEKGAPTDQTATIRGFAGATPVGLVTVGAEGKERRIQNVAAGLISETSTDAINGSQLYAFMKNVKLPLAAGGGAVGNLTGDTNITVMEPEDPKVTDAKTVISLNKDIVVDTVKAGKSVTVGDIVVKDNKITGIETSKIIAPKDAVNVEYLESKLANTVGDVNVRLDAMNNELGRGVAQANALAGLKALQYDPIEPSQIMAGVGGYAGHHSLALGLAHYKNESTLLHFGLAVGSGSHVSYNGGISWKFGKDEDKKLVPERYRKGPISGIYVMEDEITAIKAQNKALQDQVTALQEQGAALQEQVKYLMTKLKK